ncbi:MAG: calcium/sodium antiporter, partial [Longimicrobiales bacterium]|nr:calcium/sodium antiporter [Longimicrobiales bacterium]
VVSLGTSAPELIVAVLATLRGNSDIAVGNVLGSNLVNIGLILGASALVRPRLVAERVVRRDIPIMIFLTLFLFPLIIDREVGRLDGAVLTLFMGIYLTYVFYRGRKVPKPLISGYAHLAGEVGNGKGSGLFSALGLLVAGTLGLLLGGRAIVESAIYLSGSFGVSELGIGLTVVAVGTSLPEMATSIMAAARGQTDIAVGNVIGSNIFNIAGVLGVTSIIKPVAVDPGVLWVELPAVVLVSLMALLVTLSPMLKGEYRIRRWEGALLLVTYVGLGFWIF